jgi:hypothetical protein
MIHEKDGRAWSVRTIGEEQKLLKEAMDALSPEEQQALEEMLASMGQNQNGPTLFDQVGDIEYKHRPVDIETFIKDEYFLGKTCDNLYPQLQSDLKEFFGAGYYNEAIFTGSIGWGKTFTASIAICRILYELSCMKNPHRTYGIAAGSNMSFVCLSVNETLAIKVAFENIATKIDASGYFMEHFPYERTKTELRFPGHIWVAARATTDTAALGLNTIGAMMDEGNFIPNNAKQNDPRFAAVDRAEVIYNSLKRRLKSRFQDLGRLPGAIFIISSKQTSEDFTANRIKESLNDPTVFVRDYALWDVKPRELYSQDLFHVLVGNEQTPSKILDPQEVAHFKEDKPEGCIVIEVPVDFYSEFDSDLEGSIRDIAGIATVSVSPYIQRREKIEEAVDPGRFHPFTEMALDASKGGRFKWSEMVRPRLEKGSYGVKVERMRPIINPNAPRHVHIDPALKNDALGFCMSHIGGWKDVERRGADNSVYTERAPIYVVDVILQVIPPAGDEIILGDIRQLIYDLSSHGYTITKVTMDQFQSADTLQVLGQKGYKAELLSCDRTAEPYDNLKTALYENRVLYYNYPPLLKELRELELHFKNKRRKVDHPLLGSKDCSDALAGVCYTLSDQQESVPLPMMKGMAYYGGGEAWLPEQKQAQMAGDKAAGQNSKLSELPPFLIGGGNGGDDWGGGWGPGSL